MEDLFLSVLQVSLTAGLVIAALLLCRGLLQRRYPARACCFVWLLVAARLLLPLQLTFPPAAITFTPHSYRLQYTAGDATAPQVEWTTRAGAEQPAGSASSPRPHHTLAVGAVLATLWLLGAILSLALRLASYWQFRRRMRTSLREVQNPALVAAFQQESAWAGLSGRVRLWVCPQVACPLLVGWRHPLLLLPDERLSALDAPFVFRHELTHVRHGDLWLKAVLALAHCLHWFNPLVAAMLRSASEDIELACDQAIVQGLPVAERKRYGTAILNSVEAQCRRRQVAFTSGFSGDRRSLMRRLQSLFGGRAKRRGGVLLALVLLALITLGGCFAVRQNGAGGTAQLEQQLTELASRWGSAFQHRDGQPLYQLMAKEPAAAFYQQRLDTLAMIDPDGQLSAEQREHALWCIGVSSPSVDAYTVASVDAKHLQATLVYDWRLTGSPHDRTAERLTFVREGGALKVQECGNAYVSGSQPLSCEVDSLSQFELLYGNDLGLPDVDFLYHLAESGGDPGFDRRDPKAAASNILHLTGGAFTAASDYYADDKLAGQTLTYRFADGSVIRLDMLQLYDIASIPVDWSRSDGSNSRTASDLAQQWARGVASKSGQFIYPILSAEQRTAFVQQQRDLSGEGDWYWKVGGSSPSFRGWAITPTANPDTQRIVFLAYGGGVDDYRTWGPGYVWELTTATSDRHLVVTQAAELDTSTLPGLERFQLLFGHGLPLPGYDADQLQAQAGDLYDADFRSALRQPTTAALALFGLQNTADATLAAAPSAAEATVICRFRDGSGTVQISMRLVEGTPYWMPTGWVEDEPPAN